MIERLLLIPLILLVSSPLAFGTSDPLSCADNSIVAGAVPTTKDIQTFVQCAYELVREVGFDEAYRAFHEDGQWRSGPTYVFVDEVTPMAELAQAFVFPPDPSREGSTFGRLLIDAFSNYYYRERHRILSSFGEGWI